MTENKRSDLQVDIAIILVWGGIFIGALAVGYFFPLAGLFLASFIFGFAITQMFKWRK